jgi:putative transposase
MPYWRLHYHIVWSTKNRLPMLDDDIEKRLFSFLIQKAKQRGCFILAVNGCVDHVHVIIDIPPMLSVSEVVKSLKGASSHDFAEIYWQEGYGALTVGERALKSAITYVEGQKEHHRDKTVNGALERWGEESEDV